MGEQSAYEALGYIEAAMEDLKRLCEVPSAASKPALVARLEAAGKLAERVRLKSKAA